MPKSTPPPFLFFPLSLSLSLKKPFYLLLDFFDRAILNFTKPIIQLVEKIAATIDNVFPYPYNEELKGIAQASGSDLGDVIVANIIYDVTAWAISISKIVLKDRYIRVS